VLIYFGRATVHILQNMRIARLVYISYMDVQNVRMIRPCMGEQVSRLRRPSLLDYIMRTLPYELDYDCM
jgi:hypothetical protein